MTKKPRTEKKRPSGSITWDEARAMGMSYRSYLQGLTGLVDRNAKAATAEAEDADKSYLRGRIWA
ncbi:hypothetical protein [Bradyrhizobium japonicum]|uniref:hypothetical protein n=1 Tax=Bradyrhizobium japonicum TaxID=375 RepID=UPI0004816755|nr:hypothetical protein [Bradyrhizobium japonicum]